MTFKSNLRIFNFLEVYMFFFSSLIVEISEDADRVILNTTLILSYSFVQISLKHQHR